MKRSFCYRGTTLIELMVVLVILVILVTLGAVVFMDQSTRASREGAITSGNALVKALAMYKAEWGNYPVVTSVTPLYPYANVTQLQTEYNAVTILRTGTAVCIQGEVKDIAPPYFTTLCAETDNSSVQTHADKLPTCLWVGKHGWQPCKDGL